MKMHEEYLGDGLYASFNGYQFCLRAPRELSDYQRSLLKLPTRGRPDGWTIDEILAWEKYRLEAMLMPLIMAVEASESGFRQNARKPRSHRLRQARFQGRKKTTGRRMSTVSKATVHAAPMPINEAMENDWVAFQKSRYWGESRPSSSSIASPTIASSRRPRDLGIIATA
jgi:hypothetical protein